MGTYVPILDVGVPGARVFAVTANPGALAATTAANIDVTGFHGVTPDDLLFVIPNVALEARLMIQSASCPVAGTIRLRFINQSAGAAAGGALVHLVVAIRRGA